MHTVSFYFDEDTDEQVAQALRLRGVDVLTTTEAGRKGTDDQFQLEYAMQEGRVIVTCNKKHYPGLNDRWWKEGRVHSGIVIADQNMGIGEMMRRLLNLSRTVSVEQMKGQIRWLSEFPDIDVEEPTER